MVESRLSVGNVEILVLHDNETNLPLAALFPNVPAENWAEYQERYPEAFGGSDSSRIHFCVYLIRSGGRTIMVDTGAGSKATNPGTVAAFAGGVDGRLMSELETAGVRPEDVDTVFFTHLHPDHVGWNLTQRGDGLAPTFPNARYVFHQAEREAFITPHDQEMFSFSFWEETISPLENWGMVDILTGEKALTDEITAIPTLGHTPGSMSLAIHSLGQRALLLGDVFHGPTQVTETSWALGFDMDPGLAAQTRARMMDRAEAEEATVGICHHSGFGRVVRIEGKRYWQGI